MNLCDQILFYVPYPIFFQEYRRCIGICADQFLYGFHHDLTFVEGIGPVYSGKLREAGLTTPLDLLERCATRKDRASLAEETGISHKLILTWVNQLDLYRIKGIGTQYADMLEAAGVDTVIELAQRNPENLHARIIEANQEKNLVREVPSQSQVTNWIEQAKELPRIITY